VGTKMDAFVFDTLNAWYQEDMGYNSVRIAHFGSLPLVILHEGGGGYPPSHALRQP
jgi:hypothetical protein